MPPDDPATLVSVYNLVVEVVRHPRRLPQRLEDTTLSLSVARGLGDPVALFWAVGHRMRATFEMGLVEESDHLFHEMLAIASGIGEPALLGRPATPWPSGHSCTGTSSGATNSPPRPTNLASLRVSPTP